jgi:hypothetical protein
MVMQRDRKVTIGTSLPSSLTAILDKHAFEERVSVAAIVRRAVFEYLERRGLVTADESQEEAESETPEIELDTENE